MVDYNLGWVKILNIGIFELNVFIKIFIESNLVFGFQVKFMIGIYLNYCFNKDFNVGVMWFCMMECLVIQKVDYGSEFYKNNVFGVDFKFCFEVLFIIKFVDLFLIIFIKEKFIFSIFGEVVYLILGMLKVIFKFGILYVDDFEGF